MLFTSEKERERGVICAQKKKKKIENFTIVHAILTIFSVNRSIIVFNVPWV